MRGMCFCMSYGYLISTSSLNPRPRVVTSDTGVTAVKLSYLPRGRFAKMHASAARLNDFYFFLPLLIKFILNQTRKSIEITLLLLYSLTLIFLLS